MTDSLIIEKATEELEMMSWAITEQFLEVHKVVYFENKPKVARVDREKENLATVYFEVEEEKFFLAVYLQLDPTVLICGVSTEPFHSVYFRASSDKLSMNELSHFTKLTSTGGRNKGDNKNPNGEIVWKESTIFFEPNPEVDEFGNKLTKLLDYLEQDIDGVEKLVRNAGGYIQVYSCFHNGNTMIGGHQISKDQINRMSKLNLEIDFDISAQGNFYK
jgi:hypothetical protein